MLSYVSDCSQLCGLFIYSQRSMKEERWWLFSGSWQWGQRVFLWTCRCHVFVPMYASVAEEGYLISYIWVYLSFSPLLFTSLLFTAICKASPDSHFAFLHFFSRPILWFPTERWNSGYKRMKPLNNSNCSGTLAAWGRWFRQREKHGEPSTTALLVSLIWLVS